MAFRPLVDGECGGSNSLVQLSSMLTRDSGIMAGPINSNQGENFVDEYLAQNQMQPPQTFQMNTLLSSLRDIQGASSSTNNMEQWLGEFSQIRKHSNVGPSIWNTISSAPPLHPMMVARNMAYQPPRADFKGPNLEYVDEEQYHASLMNNQQGVSQERPSEVQERAKELVEAVVDQNVAYSQFIDFMKKVGSGEIPMEMPGDATTEATKENKTFHSQAEQLELISENYKEEWAKLSDVQEHPWLSQFSQKTNPYPEYNFTQDNSMAENPDALGIGKEKLRLGDVPGAVLCFEASVKQNPKLVEGWLLLGTTQAENEQDPRAIAALNQCVQLDPTCLHAYSALGASYTNENYPHLAYQAFNNWLKANPKYSDLVPADVDLGNMNNVQLQEHLQSNFIRAAQMNPDRVDPDIQCALGVLFNISQEYNKAVDCFRAALMVKNDDSRLWNKLGATLANGERPEEAVEAYYQALNLEPGFIRARYNVGITCMNLGAHKEAAEHFLIALNQQAKAQGVTPTIPQEDTSSSTIWSTLRMVCAFMGKHEITPLIDSRNLTQLNQYFGIE